MGKGEIARYECFQKACFPEASKGVIVWKWVKLEQSLQVVNTSANFIKRAIAH